MNPFFDIRNAIADSDYSELWLESQIDELASEIYMAIKTTYFLVRLDDLDSQIAIGLKKAGIGEEYLDCLLAVIMEQIRDNHQKIDCLLAVIMEKRDNHQKI